MKKILSFLVLLSILIIPAISLSVGFTDPIPGVSLASLFNSILYVFWVVAAAFAVVCFVIAGIMFLTAQGDPAKLKTARSAVIFGVVGVAVAILAYSIISIVLSVL